MCVAAPAQALPASDNALLHPAAHCLIIELEVAIGTESGGGCGDNWTALHRVDVRTRSRREAVNFK